MQESTSVRSDRYIKRNKSEVKNMAYCENCGKECEVRSINHSFSHEFGTEYIYSIGSNCCEATCYESICEACQGEGCPECRGTGLIDEITEIQSDYFAE